MTTDLDTGEHTAALVELMGDPQVGERQPRPAAAKKIRGRTLDVDVLTGEGPRLSRLSARGVTPSPPRRLRVSCAGRKLRKRRKRRDRYSRRWGRATKAQDGDRATKAQDKAVVAKAADRLVAARSRTQAVRVTSHPTGRPPAHSHRATKSQISAHSSRGMAYPGTCQSGRRSRCRPAPEYHPGSGRRHGRLGPVRK